MMHSIKEKWSRRMILKHPQSQEEYEEEESGRGREAWERTYADERSWEYLQEDESGLLRPIDNKTLSYAQYRRRLIRYLYLIIDFFRTSGGNKRIFYQNPLSQIVLVILKDGVAHYLTDLGGSPEAHIKALMGKLGTSGDASLQNGLDLVRDLLNQIPSYVHREVLILYSSLSTCNPGDILETIQKCKAAKIRCSVIGLSAELYICKHLCQETGGMYFPHLKELVLEHALPPPAIVEFVVANLIKMGFPQRAAEVGGGYTCLRCKTHMCELPTECCISRSYHHLFPIRTFDDISPLVLKGLYKLPGPQVACPKCNQHFCLDCDIYIHESLHNSPGCESLRNSKAISDMEE
ncbi:unnamed protein product [Withania somnifera]